MNKDDLLGPAVPAPAEEAPPRRQGRPLLATIIGCGFILLSARPLPNLPADRSEMIAELLGYAVMGVVIVWAIAWLITIRRSSAGWWVGSFAAMAVASVLAGLYSIGSGLKLADRDTFEAARQVKQAFASAQPIKVEANSGPVLRMSAAMFNGVIEDSLAFQGDAEAVGLTKIVSFDGLTPQSPVLSHCERLDPLAGRAETIGGHWSIHLAEAHNVGEEAVRDNRLSPNQLQDFESGVQSSEPAFRRLWTLNGALVTETAGLCRLLHARSWHLAGRTAVFSSRDDLAAFRGAAGRINAIIAEQAQLRQAEQAKSDRAGL